MQLLAFLTLLYSTCEYLNIVIGILVEFKENFKHKQKSKQRILVSKSIKKICLKK